MRVVFATVLGFALLAPSAPSQTINVDFEPASGASGVPPATYGAAALSPGYWNAVSADSWTNLLAVDGSPTVVSVANNTLRTLVFFDVDDPSTSGADDALLDDFHMPYDAFAWSFTGLAPGEYEIYTISVHHGGNILWTDVTVLGSPEGTLNVWGTWGGGGYTAGSNYTRHTKTVTDGTITLQFVPIGLADHIYVNGIQLVRKGDTLVGIPQCFGDGSGAACPCANPGAPAHGCQNSAGTGGAFLTASGATSPDSIVLHASGELPTALTIFLQGNATVGPLDYGDGLRCAGGILKRLYTGPASAGAISRPGPGDPSITARSAALGDPILPGERRYYQTYYRDANPGFCPPPSGNTFNISNAVRVTW